MSDEQVLVVARERCPDAGAWHGLRTDGLAAFLGVIAQDGRYEPRDAMEQDPAYKQIIPYLVLRDGDHYFLMRRTQAGADRRLHDRWSIGVGGHLNPGDDGLLGGLRREWQEELDADFVPEFQLIGLLNDDTTDVGRVHLGAVYLADAADRRVEVRETEKLTGRFATPDEVAAVSDDMETWSRLVFEAIEQEAAAGVSGVR